MGVAKVTLNGTTLMDVTSKTVTASTMLSGTTALDKAGNSITGTYDKYLISKTVHPTAQAQTILPENETAQTVNVTNTDINTYSWTVGENWHASSDVLPLHDLVYGIKYLVKYDMWRTTTGSTYHNIEGLLHYDQGVSDMQKPPQISAISNIEIVSESGTVKIRINFKNSADSSYKITGMTFTPVLSDLIGYDEINVDGDSNLTSANIKKGVSIFGVNGSYEGSGGGGGGETTTEGGVNFIDYDGTLLHSYTATQWASQTALPANPSHTGLVAQGWNWTKAKIDEYLTSYPEATVNVGQMYVTASGKTEIDINADNPDFLSPYLAICPNGTVTIDWGDGSATETVTGTSYTTLKYTPHTYTSVGRYTITLDGQVGFYCSSTNYGPILINRNFFNTRKTYTQYIEQIRLGLNAHIGSYAFTNCYSLQSITIPDGITGIGVSVFSNCYALQSITIPDSVTSIDINAFYNCYSLQSIAIPDSVTSIGSNAFYGCYSLQSITIPDGVTSISTQAFYSCNELRSITIPGSVTSIGGNAFTNCYSLQSITIPDSVTSIGDKVFNSCYSLQSVTISDGVTSIGNSAFISCYSLPSITIPDSVTSIGGNAFSSCYTLRSINVSDWNKFDSNNISFMDCRALQSITIPDGVTSISTQAFSSCYALRSITIPDSVTSIGNAAFISCFTLQSITIPDGVTIIGSSVFYNCYSLQSITIPDSVTSIGVSAFYGCYSLQSITIPDGVTSIGSSAFYNCYSIMEYHLLPTTPPTLAGTNAFTGIVAGTKIYVPQGCLEAYQTATNWSTYASYMQEEPS